MNNTVLERFAGNDDTNVAVDMPMFHSSHKHLKGI
jgi:hypothetical protein